MATVTPVRVGPRKGNSQSGRFASSGIVILMVTAVIAVILGRLFKGSVDELLILIPDECEAV